MKDSVKQNQLLISQYKKLVKSTPNSKQSFGTGKFVKFSIYDYSKYETKTTTCQSLK